MLAIFLLNHHIFECAELQLLIFGKTVPLDRRIKTDFKAKNGAR